MIKNDRLCAFCGLPEVHYSHALPPSGWHSFESETVENFNCDKCGLPITGIYGSLGGNIEPYIASKCYHLQCIPSVDELDQGEFR